MRVCGGCEGEYEEEFKFCPQCGRPFGGPAVEEERSRLDRHLRGLVAHAERENTFERRLRASGSYDFDGGV